MCGAYNITLTCAKIDIQGLNRIQFEKARLNSGIVCREKSQEHLDVDNCTACSFFDVRWIE